MFKKGQKSEKKIAKGFISYGGYVSELSLFKNAEGKWFKVYKSNLDVFDADKIKSIFPETGYRAQVLATSNDTYILIGVKSDLPEDAVKKLEKYDSVEWLSALTAEEWFQVMATKLTGDDFVGFPIEKKEKRKKAIDSVMPYNVSVQQTSMALSGKTVRTILLIGYPSKTYAAFATELLNISDKITMSLHITHVDAELCLEGLKFADEIRAKRKETMREFLTDAEKRGTGLYQTACLVSIVAEGDETEQIFKRVTDFCKRYLMGFSNLDFQQKEAFVSTLPLLENKIIYNTVLANDSLLGLCPWSKLKERQNGVPYGEDTLIGEAKYNRFVSGAMESGCILSSKREVMTDVVVKELTYLVGIGEKPVMLIDDSWSDFQGKSTEEFEKKADYVCKLNEGGAELYRQMVMHWARNCILTNGQASRGKVEIIRKTAMAIEPSETFLEDFTTAISDASLKSACAIRPFPGEIAVERYVGKESGIRVFVVKGTQLQKELSYSYILSRCKGIVYALDMELLAAKDADLLQMCDNATYTFSSTKLDAVYRTKMASKVIKRCQFVLLGEHKISHKIALIDTLTDGGLYLSKKEQNWISEPAKGNMLITGLTSYTLKG